MGLVACLASEPMRPAGVSAGVALQLTRSMITAKKGANVVWSSLGPSLALEPSFEVLAGSFPHSVIVGARRRLFAGVVEKPWGRTNGSLPVSLPGSFLFVSLTR